MFRKVNDNDATRIDEIYSIARDFMKKTGNPNQWGDSHPAKALLSEYKGKGFLYAYVEEEQILGVFALIPGEDETYKHIEEGEWLNDEYYATLHAVASSGEVKGVFEKICTFAKSQYDNLRIDTHYDNLVMQHCIEKQGFQSCGRIYVRDHSPRKAYQWVKGSRL